VSISKNGALLAVATVSEVKLFYLKPPKSSRSKGLRVQKINCPDQLMKNGSKLIEISPDGNWLMVVRNDNSVYMHRIKQSQDSETRVPQPRVLNTSVMLSRLQRTHVLTSPSQGTHGPYENTIVRAAWSSDSRILVVGDLSGSLDSWVLEGHEDPSLSEAEVAQQPKALAVADSDDSDDDSSDEESHPTLFSGQHWIRNPKAEMLPRLTSFPLILSFRPATSRTKLPVNGITPHPTRHNPHPHSHELPKGEDRLLVLTSLHQIYEFHILSGALTEWSRRNSSGGLPEEFQAIRERAINCVWNVNDKRQRIWLYGSNWLWMFDLSQDFPINVNVSEGNVSNEIVKAGKKRKRRLLAQERKELRKNTSGAGSKIADEELNVGIGNKIRKLVGVGSEENEGQWISLEPGGVQVRAEEEDGYDTDLEEREASALVKFRRSENGEVTDALSGEAADSKADSGPAYWHTFKYRPILAIVPLEEDELDESGAEGGPVDISGAGSGVEVALVERPLWDLDLPPKYHGDQEWNPEK
jgi:U3 small nucleolar RNA-associated protein 4